MRWAAPTLSTASLFLAPTLALANRSTCRQPDKAEGQCKHRVRLATHQITLVSRYWTGLEMNLDAAAEVVFRAMVKISYRHEVATATLADIG